MGIEIVDFPIKNGESFHSYVKLPEGTKVFIRVDIMVIFLGYDGNIYPTIYDIIEYNLGGNGVWLIFPYLTQHRSDKAIETGVILVIGVLWVYQPKFGNGRATHQLSSRVRVSLKKTGVALHLADLYGWDYTDYTGINPLIVNNKIRSGPIKRKCGWHMGRSSINEWMQLMKFVHSDQCMGRRSNNKTTDHNQPSTVFTWLEHHADFATA